MTWVTQRIHAINHYQSPHWFLPNWQTKFQGSPVMTTSIALQQSCPRPSVTSRAARVPADMFISGSWDTTAPSSGVVELTAVTAGVGSNIAAPSVSTSASEYDVVKNTFLDALRNTHGTSNLDATGYGQ